MTNNTNNIENSENNGIFQKRANIGWLVLFLVVIASFIGLVDHTNKLSIKLSDANKTIAIYEAAKTDVEIDCDINQDSLLRRDIELYIRARYTRVPKVVAKSIAENIMDYSGRYDISPELLVGIIEIESGFNPMVKSKKDARGLMQVMPEWASKFKIAVNDLHDIDIGIESGIKVFLIHLKEAKGSISKGLYYYVGKDKTYSDSVYTSVGRFVSFRSTINDIKKIAGKEKTSDRTDKRAKVNIEGTTPSNTS